MGDTAKAIRLGVRPLSDEERRQVATALQDGDLSLPTDGAPLALATDARPPGNGWRERLAAGFLFQSEHRFNANIASLGRRALLALTHLHDAGGSLSGAELGKRLKIDRAQLSRMLRRCQAAGVIEREGRTVTLADGWRQAIDEAVREMPSFGFKAMRTAAALAAGVVQDENRLTTAFQVANESPPSEWPEHERQIDRIDHRLAQRRAMLADIRAWAVENLPRHKSERIQRDAATAAERQAAEWRHRAAQGRRRLHSHEQSAQFRVKVYQSQRCGAGQIASLLQADGFSRQTIAVAMEWMR